MKLVICYTTNKFHTCLDCKKQLDWQNLTEENNGAVENLEKENYELPRLMCQILHTIQPQETGTNLTAFFQLKQDHYQHLSHIQEYSYHMEINCEPKEGVTIGAAKFK